MPTMNDILSSIIYQLNKETSLSTEYLADVLVGWECEEIEPVEAGLLVKGYIKALHDMGGILPEVWEVMTDRISDFLAIKK